MRVDSDRFMVATNRLFHLSLFGEDDAQIVVRIRMTGVDAQNVPIALGGFRQPALILEGVAQVEAGI